MVQQPGVPARGGGPGEAPITSLQHDRDASVACDDRQAFTSLAGRRLTAILLPRQHYSIFVQLVRAPWLEVPSATVRAAVADRP
jgi:hypothetical protein